MNHGNFKFPYSVKKDGLVLYNVVIPLFFYEIQQVFLGFGFVVLIETVVIFFVLNARSLNLFGYVILANVISTLCGYFLQGILRLTILLLIPQKSNIFFENQIIRGIFGNLSIGSVGKNETFPVMLTTAVATSCFISFMLSIVIELLIIRYALRNEQYRKKQIFKAVIFANVFSYFFLFLWVLDRTSRMY